MLLAREIRLVSGCSFVAATLDRQVVGAPTLLRCPSMTTHPIHEPGQAVVRCLNLEFTSLQTQDLPRFSLLTTKNTASRSPPIKTKT